MNFGNATSAAKNIRMRRLILEILQTNHDAQQSRYDSTALWSALVTLRFDTYQNEVVTLLQDLSDRGFVRYGTMRNNKNGDVWLTAIELTARGRDVLEGTITDPAVGE